MKYIRIHSKNDLTDWLKYEKTLYFTNGCLHALWQKIIRSETAVLWEFQKRLRKTEYYINCGKIFSKIYSEILLNRMMNKYCLRIEPNVFGKGLRIMHLGPILTNKNVRFGENARIHINTTIVASGNNLTPKFGNDVIIGVGATVMGDIFIGDRNVIGAGAVCNKTFEENNINIAGVPAKKISNR